MPLLIIAELPLNIETRTRRPLDLLPDRTAEAVLPWLLSHSGG